MICASCGTDNRPGRRFCRSCGSGLAAGCPICGAVAEPGDRFCGSCGAPLPEGEGSSPGRDGAPPTPTDGVELTAPTTERRLVSILFADLVGSTAMAEGQDVEAVRELLEPVLRPMPGDRRPLRWDDREVHRRRGDGRLGQPGRPRGRRRAGRPHGAGPGRCGGHAAQPDRDAARGPGRGADRRGRRRPRGARAGDGRRRPGEHRQPAPVRRAAGNRSWSARRRCDRARRPSTTSPPGSRSCTGRTAPVPAWRALRVVAGRRGSGRATRLEAPFVGRDDELRLLKERPPPDRPRASSPPRLDHRHRRDRQEPARLGAGEVHRRAGRRRLLAPGPLAGLRRRARVLGARRDGPAARAHRRDGRSDERPGEARGDDRRVPHRTPTSGHGSSPGSRPCSGLEAAPPGGRRSSRRPGERSSSGSPTVVRPSSSSRTSTGRIPGLLDFVEGLLAAARTRPILVLALARPELIAVAADLGRDGPQSTAARPRTARRRGDGDAPAGSRARDPAGGDRGHPGTVGGDPALRRRDRPDAHRPGTSDRTRRVGSDLVGDLGTLSVPDSLQALLGSRLDALDARDPRPRRARARSSGSASRSRPWPR